MRPPGRVGIAVATAVGMGNTHHFYDDALACAVRMYV